MERLYRLNNNNDRRLLKMKAIERAKELIDFVEKGTSPYHAVIEVKRQLMAADFIELKMADEWQLDFGKSYFVSPYPSSLFAFTISTSADFNQGFKIIMAHTDQPGFRVKPSPEMSVGGYLKVNTEVYGGPILNTWLDRPLSIAGKVVLRSQEIMAPRVEYIDMKAPLLIIPNLSIHMNREVNKGVALNRQVDMLPLMGLLEDQLNKEDFFIKTLADHLNVPVGEILDFDLGIYVTERGQLIGLQDAFITAPRLDDLSMVQAATTAMIEQKPSQGINIIAFFDHEEVGSRSKQGADSMLFRGVMERIAEAMYLSPSHYHRALSRSFLISADGGHALHPNHPEMHDPTNQPEVGKGLLIKMSHNQSYATDSEAVAICQQLCEKAEVPYQKYINRSDAIGGRTLGPLATTYVPIRGVEVGEPMLSMHSARELISAKDHRDIIQLFKTYFAE